MLALLSGALVTLIGVASPDVIGSVAGLALLGTLASSLAAALSRRARPGGRCDHVRDRSLGVTFLSVGSAFWALLAGLGVQSDHSSTLIALAACSSETSTSSGWMMCASSSSPSMIRGPGREK